MTFTCYLTFLQKRHTSWTLRQRRKCCCGSFHVPHLFTSARQICCSSIHIWWTFMHSCVLCMPSRPLWHMSCWKFHACNVGQILFILFCIISHSQCRETEVLIRHFFLLCLKGFALVLHSKCRSLSWPYMAFFRIFKATSALFQRPLSRCWQMLQQRPHSTELKAVPCSVQP